MIYLLLVVFLVLIALGTPISFAMLISAAITLLVNGGFPLDVLVQRVVFSLDSMSLLAVPLFLFAGELMNAGGITKRIMDFCSALVGHIKGGLCHVSVLACMIFAGVSGSSNADTAAVSSIAVPAMRDEGYDDDVAVSVVACGGTIGPIIPPSIPLIIFGSITSISVGRLLMAGMIPGIIFGLALMGVSSIYAHKRNYPTRPRAKMADIWKAFRKSILALFAPVVILGGIVSGVFTATEAGAVAAVYCLVVSAIYKELSVKKIKEAILNTARSSASVLIIIAAGTLFGWILAIAQFPTAVATFIGNLTSNSTVIILLFIGMMLVIGLFIEGLAAMAILVPVFMPIITSIGYDPVQFGILFLLCISIGAITPPVGMVLFTACGVTNTPLKKVGKTIYIFAFGLLVATLLVAFIPQLSLFVPNLMMGVQ